MVPNSVLVSGTVIVVSRADMTDSLYDTIVPPGTIKSASASPAAYVLAFYQSRVNAMAALLSREPLPIIIIQHHALRTRNDSHPRFRRTVHTTYRAKSSRAWRLFRDRSV